MRVLVVAPSGNLKNVEDWVASASGHQLDVLNRTVTVREVLSCIASGGYEVVHFATHGCLSALEVSDGVIPSRLLEDAIRASGTVELVILGACKSVAIGAALYKAGVPRVLSWRDDVGDGAATAWAGSFYSSLRMSGDIYDATLTASEAVTRLGAEPPIYLNGRLTVLEDEVKELKRRREVAGVPAWLMAVLGVYGLALLALLSLAATH